jgi:hypothetical protein
MAILSETVSSRPAACGPIAVVTRPRRENGSNRPGGLPKRRTAGPSSRESALRNYFDEIRSTSNTNVAFGGITPPAPRAP